MFDTVRSRIQTAIACALSRNHEVIVVCGEEGLPAGHDDSHFARDYGIKVVRCKELKYERNHPLSRMVGLIRFTHILSSRASEELRPGDTVLIDTDPSLLLLQVARLRKRKDFKMAVLVHDLFPENTIAAGFINRRNPLYKLAVSVFNRAYASADMLITIGKDMEQMLLRKIAGGARKPRIDIVTNWAFHTTDSALKYPESDKLTLMFAGTVGRLQGLEKIIPTFASAANPLLRLEIHGGGAKRLDVENEVKKFPDSLISLNPPYNKHEELDILANADLSLVSLIDGMYGLGVPSKTYTIMMCGRPILYIGDRGTEIWDLVEKEGIGFCFTPSDKAGLAHFLKGLTLDKRPMLQEMGERARNICIEHYTKEIVLERFCELFNEK